ncbi:MAG: SPOR domain-containing protein [Gemmatimonadaceae bacterium]
MRFPLGGGAARAFVYPRLDSAVWTSAQRTPAIERILGFDPSAGSVVAVDAKGVPIRVDLRLNTIERASAAKLAHLASNDGASVYGMAPDGRIRRFAPSDSGWVFKPPAPAREIFPQPDGSLFVLSDRGATTTIWHLRPPLNTIIDSVVLPRAERAIGTQIGDRLYLTVNDALIGVRSKDMKNKTSITLPGKARTAVTTPSGDRIYVAADSAAELWVIDRYNGKVDTKIELPDQASELRMDAAGRYVLARPVKGDSAWVIAVGTDRRLGTVRTEWRGDLPTVIPDGAIVLLHGNDVAFADGETLRPKSTVSGGARDSWLFVSWNGFRARGAIGQPTMAHAVTTATDSAANANNPFAGQVPGHDSVTVADTAARAQPKDSAVRSSPGFMVQFAALSGESAAKEIAKAVSVTTDGARVVSTVRDGVAIFRVVIGPYATRAEADRAAKLSGRSYWIYEGAP